MHLGDGSSPAAIEQPLLELSRLTKPLLSIAYAAQIQQASCIPHVLILPERFLR
jgi:hypothetical protein